MKVIIAGLGLMGGSMAMALSKLNNGLEIYGYDYPEVMQLALEKGYIDKKIINWPHDCSDADIVFLATSIETIKHFLDDLNGIVNKNTIVTDIGSTKVKITTYVREINFSGTYIGGHPLTGSEKKGLSAVNPLLYENAVYIITTGEQKVNEVPEGLSKLLESLKARVLNISATEHDQIVSYISHLPQLLSISLMNLVGNKDDDNSLYLKLAAGGFRDLTRIASSSFTVWKDIIGSNSINVKGALKEYMKYMQNILDNVENLENEFSKANAYRRQLPKDHKGFISPLVDVLVEVTDEVGVIYKISTALYKEKIDIRDIELIKIREGEAGIFKLSFESSLVAERAIKILNSLNYKSNIRE